MANNAWSNDSLTTLTVGTPGGQRIVIINPATGDAIDIYTSTNALVFSIDANGVLTSLSAVNPGAVQLINGQIQFLNSFTPFLPNPSIFGNNPGSIATLNLRSGARSGPAQNISSITLSSGTPGSEHVSAQQRGIFGNLMQTDDGGLTPGSYSLVHVNTYTVTWGAPGVQTFNHGASFTPNFASATFIDGSAINFAFLAMPQNFTSTTAQINALYSTSANPAVGDLVIFQATFYG